MATVYIQRRCGSDLETVDEFENNSREDRKYINDMLAEYQMSDREALYYKSSRPCRDWK